MEDIPFALCGGRTETHLISLPHQRKGENTMHIPLTKQLGFVFAAEQTDTGDLKEIKVLDRWFAKRSKSEAHPFEELTIRLRPFASYEEAQEIANWLNHKLITGYSPIIDVHVA
ncbi:MAG: hypothetical protein COY40_03130 [Alphaproteobacteria bacterium CG_4_10_14_0_8_um_filter_53_9]|nr:MAG: hypothetical protein COY40_03130 [Alphaproteobacteria bacterium CG_4_10_14_0_8_um_filter_53_9]